MARYERHEIQVWLPTRSGDQAITANHRNDLCAAATARGVGSPCDYHRALPDLVYFTSAAERRPHQVVLGRVPRAPGVAGAVDPAHTKLRRPGFDSGGTACSALCTG